MLTGMSIESCLVTLLAVLLTTIFIVLRPLSLWKAGAVGSKNAKLLLLLGSSSSGKSCLFFKWQRGEICETVSSVKENRARLTIDGVKVECVDLPGHRNLRFKSKLLMNQCKAIIFLVDASDKTRLKEAAESLFDVLTSAPKGCQILLACNKAERPGARKDKLIVADIERELNRMRQSRAQNLEGDEEGSFTLGVEGEPFKFEEHANNVTTCSCSVHADDLGSVNTFVKSVFE